MFFSFEKESIVKTSSLRIHALYTRAEGGEKKRLRKGAKLGRQRGKFRGRVQSIKNVSRAEIIKARISRGWEKRRGWMFEIFSRSAESSRWEIFIDSPTSRRVWLGVNMISPSPSSSSLWNVSSASDNASCPSRDMKSSFQRVHPRMKYYLSFALMMGVPLSLATHWEEEIFNDQNFPIFFLGFVL